MVADTLTKATSRPGFLFEGDGNMFREGDGTA